jgi:DNA repair exonuclease SbcCD nuclease subunit
VIDEEHGLAVHGQGFATRSVTENLVLAYPDRLPGLVNVGLLHTSVDGAPGHDDYAPCSADDLAACCYEYFALGHVHTRRTVCDGEHVAAFSGNLQGRHPRETGPKGALVVDVEPGARAEIRHEVLDVARWEKVRVDVSRCGDLDDVLDAVNGELLAAGASAGDRTLVAQVTLTGTSAAMAALLDAERLRTEVDLLAEKAGAVIEQVRNRVRAPEFGAVVDADLAGSVARAMAVEVADPAVARELAAPLHREFGRRLREAGLDLQDRAQLAGLAARAEQELLAHLSGSGR